LNFIFLDLSFYYSLPFYLKTSIKVITLKTDLVILSIILSISSLIIPKYLWSLETLIFIAGFRSLNISISLNSKGKVMIKRLFSWEKYKLRKLYIDSFYFCDLWGGPVVCLSFCLISFRFKNFNSWNIEL